MNKIFKIGDKVELIDKSVDSPWNGELEIIGIDINKYFDIKTLLPIQEIFYDVVIVGSDGTLRKAIDITIKLL